MNREYIKSIADGIIQAFLLRLLFDFVFSIYLLEPIEMNFILIAILVVISSISFIVLVIVKSKKRIWIKSVISFITFEVFDFIGFATLSFGILPPRDTCDADGVLFLLLACLYLAFVVILRIITLVITFIVKKEKQKEKTHIK